MELKGLVDMILSVQGGQCVNIHTQSVPHQDHLVQGGLVPEPPTLPAPVCVCDRGGELTDILHNSRFSTCQGLLV